MKKLNQVNKKQKGAALILMAFIIGIATAAYLLHALDPERLRVEQDKKTYQSLNEAKKALIAWSVSHQYTPGQLPWPDRKEAVNPNYDGSSDCVAGAGTFQPQYLLGQLPIMPTTSPCLDPNNGLTVYLGLSTYPSLGQDFRDAQGNRLWYAVSRNLVRDYETSENPVINPGMINPPHLLINTPYLRQGGTQSYPWLQVLDRNGALVSDRVAAVIIAPGDAIGGQDRTGVANPDQFLDSFKIGAAIYKNNDSALVDEDFIMGENSRNVSVNDLTFVKPYNFNDKLVYITIDELMYAIEKRVLNQTKDALSKFKIANGFYPFAADLGFHTSPNPNQNQCTQGNLRGLLPVNTPSTHTCSCTSSTRTCNCNFGVKNSISFTRGAGTFVATGGGANAPTGACSVSPLSTNTCTCNGAGGCKRASGAVQFSCNACGTCTATVAGTNRFSTTGIFTNSTGVCTFIPSQATCANSANGTFALAACNVNEMVKSLPTAGGLLPAWFMANQWEKYIVYAVSSDCTSTGTCLASASPPKITVGLNQNINAIVAGSLVDPNNSCNIVNYLSSAENTNVVISNGIQDSIYQKSQVKTLVNTDQLVTTP